MAIDNPRATTAYAANRYAPRPATGPVGKQMSAAQRDFVATLVTRTRENMRALVASTPVQGAVTADMIAEALEDFTPAATVRAIQDTLNMTGSTARQTIDALIAHDAAVAARVRSTAVQRSASASVELEDGATYRAPNGSIYHAYKGQSGRLLLKLWDAPAEVFSYYGAATRMPAGAVKLTTEEMQEFGRATGTCAICMRHLTDDESVQRGIGPVCWSKL